jgi:hypothetical protein
MSKKLAKLLRTEMSASLPAIAKILESKGRNRDKILAHINEDEAELLRMHGGSGTINPETGLMEFYDDNVYSGFTESGGTYYNPEYYTPTAEGTAAPIETSFPSYQPSAAPSAAASPAPLSDDVTFASMVRESPDFVQKLASRGLQYDEASNRVVPLGPTGADYQRFSESIDPTQLEDKRGSLERLAHALGTNKKSLLTAGVAGLGGLLQSRQAAAQGQGAKKELSALAAPYRQRGQELLTAAERGELNPVGQQQLQAMQARLAQGVEQRGGVGAQQAQAQINAYRDQLIQSQYDLGLKVLNVADNIAAGAITTGLQADQYVNELTSNYMTNIARTIYGAAPQIAQPAA